MKIIKTGITGIVLFICSMVSSVSYSSPFISEYKSGYTVAGNINRYENTLSFNNVRVIQDARNESMAEHSNGSDYLRIFPEALCLIDSKDIVEELSFIIDSFKDASVIRKLLPQTFSVSEVTDQPVNITDIQSKGDIWIAQGIVSSLNNNKEFTFVFVKKSMSPSDPNSASILKRIYLYKSHLTFGDLASAKEEVSFTEFYFDDCKTIVCCKDKALSDISTRLSEVTIYVQFVSTMVLGPIITCYVPYLLRLIHNNLVNDNNLM